MKYLALLHFYGHFHIDDWVLRVKEDMNKCKLELTEEEVASMKQKYSATICRIFEKSSRETFKN